MTKPTETKKGIQFEFGDWLLLDGVTDCQFIHPTEYGATVDINGMWLSDINIDRLTVHPKYSIREKEPTKPHYRVLVISQELYKKTAKFFLMRNNTYCEWNVKYFPLNRIHTTNQRNYFIKL